MKKVAWETALVVVGILALVFAIYRTFFLEKKKILPTYPPQYQQIDNTPKVTFPTKTPKEIEAISQSEERIVEIGEMEIKPQELAARAFDQVRFKNKTSKTIKITGSWVDISLEKGGEMVYLFEKTGRFSYEVIGLDSRLLGEVVVR